jgi:proline iminopeptidase
MPIVELNGTQLFYQETGHGLPCLVMHGGLGIDHSILSPGLDGLGGALRLVYYDRRGNGRSGRPPIETLTFAQLADDADALRAHLGHERIAVLGHSIGGAIAMEYALRHPERVSRVILVCTAPRFDVTDPAGAERLARKGMTTEMAEAFTHAGESDAALHRYVEAAGPLYFHAYDEARYRRMIGGIVYSAAALRRGFEIAAGWDILPRLAALRVPTLIVAGEGDVITPPGESETLQRSIPGAELVVLPGCGHFPWLEREREFMQAILGWLANVSKRGHHPF